MANKANFCWWLNNPNNEVALLFLCGFIILFFPQKSTSYIHYNRLSLRNSVFCLILNHHDDVVSQFQSLADLLRLEAGGSVTLSCRGLLGYIHY